MARPESLVAGNCYFSVGYYDRDLLFPLIDTLVYVGHEDDPDEGSAWLFKQPESAADHDEQAAPAEPVELIRFGDHQLHEILDFPALLRMLHAVAGDHPLNPVNEPFRVPPTDQQFESLSSEVANFLRDPQERSLTVTIRYTDDGLSIDRVENGFVMQFFTHPKVSPEIDMKVVKYFSSLDLQPTVDYFYNRGWTHVLEFPIPPDLDSIVRLCRGILTDVYSICRGDILDYRRRKKSDIGST